MKHQVKHHDLVNDIKGRQQNIVWPSPLRNSRAVDAFLWRGSPKPTVVQRIGAWLFGLTFVGFGLLPLLMVWHETISGALVMIAMGSAALLLGIKICRNAFAKTGRTPPR